MTKRIVWKEGEIVLFRLSEHLYTVGQMARSPYLAFFNVNSVDGKFGDLDLNDTPMLFVAPVARNFLQRRAEGKLKVGVTPKMNLDVPRLWLHPKVDFDARPPFRGGDLVELDPKEGAGGSRMRTVKPDFRPRTDAELNKYELTAIRIDPELTARLVVCLKLGRNVDPYKEKIVRGKEPYGVFDRPV